MTTKTFLALALCATLAGAFTTVHAEGPPLVAPDADAPEVEFHATPAQLEAAQAGVKAKFDARRKAYENLKASAAPRDWAIASQITINDMDFSPDGKVSFDEEKYRKESAARAELLRSAAVGAPDDKLVQWLALNEMPSSGGGCSSGSPPPERLSAVQNLEPDNGLAWLPSLAAAADAKDDFAIDQTLARMAAAKRYDDHVADYMLALADVAKRFPGVVETPPADEEKGITEDDAIFVATLMQGNSVGVRPYAFPDVCDAMKHTEADLRRFAACADLGRRLSREGTTFALREAGFALLKQSAQDDDADATAERDFEWLGQKVREFMGSGDREKLVAALHEGKALWLAKPDYVVVLRTLLERRGVPLTAPPGWQPDRKNAEH